MVSRYPEPRPTELIWLDDDRTLRDLNVLLKL